MSLHDYGWNEFFERIWDSPEYRGLEPGRVLSSGSGVTRLFTEAGEHPASLAGKLRQDPDARGGPVVGDWVAARAADEVSLRIEAVLPRRSKLSRKAPGRRTDEQVVAANLDLVVLVMGLDGDFNLRRLERLLTLVEQSGAGPVVLLNKRDLCEETEARLESARQVAGPAPVLTASSLTGEGVASVRNFIQAGRTAALMGSSGAGKSTLINRMLGAPVQATRSVRAGDSRGRHTTTRRELFLLPGGGLLIDNPGIREVQLWADESSLSRAFDDVQDLARGCRFRDCGHGAEPGCAVREAVDSGSLPAERLRNYHALRAELRYLETKQDPAAQREQKRRWASIHRALRRSGRSR